MRDKGLPIASLFEEAEGDGEQVMQRADAQKFEEEQKSDESLKAWVNLAIRKDETPKMRREIDKFCKSCEKCQLKARSLVMVKVPITPIPREDAAFKRMTMDVVGPIEPTSAGGHKYCLCIVDSCTRWPAVYILKSLTAKAVCEELKKLFMDVGVPSVITSDQGTNFTSSLTKEFLKMFGVTPRFNTPGHPESSGIVERWNQTFKKMIHHVIIDNP